MSNVSDANLPLETCPNDALGVSFEKFLTDCLRHATSGTPIRMVCTTHICVSTHTCIHVYIVLCIVVKPYSVCLRTAPTHPHTHARVRTRDTCARKHTHTHTCTETYIQVCFMFGIVNCIGLLNRSLFTGEGLF